MTVDTVSRGIPGHRGASRGIRRWPDNARIHVLHYLWLVIRTNTSDSRKMEGKNEPNVIEEIETNIRDWNTRNITKDMSYS